jgi:hypothetical protein
LAAEPYRVEEREGGLDLVLAGAAAEQRQPARQLRKVNLSAASTNNGSKVRLTRAACDDLGTVSLEDS